MDEKTLKSKKVAELREIAKAFGVEEYYAMKKAELIAAMVSMGEEEPQRDEKDDAGNRRGSGRKRTGAGGRKKDDAGADGGKDENEEIDGSRDESTAADDSKDENAEADSSKDENADADHKKNKKDHRN